MYSTTPTRWVYIVSDREDVKNLWMEIAHRHGYRAESSGYEDFWLKMLPILKLRGTDCSIVIDDEGVQSHELGDALVAIFHRMRPEPQVVVLVGDDDTHLDEWVKTDSRILLHRHSCPPAMALEHLAGSMVGR